MIALGAEHAQQQPAPREQAVGNCSRHSRPPPRAIQRFRPHQQYTGSRSAPWPRTRQPRHFPGQSPAVAAKHQQASPGGAMGVHLEAPLWPNSTVQPATSDRRTARNPGRRHCRAGSTIARHWLRRSRCHQATSASSVLDQLVIQLSRARRPRTGKPDQRNSRSG